MNATCHSPVHARPVVQSYNALQSLQRSYRPVQRSLLTRLTHPPAHRGQVHIRCGVALQQGTRVEVQVERAPNNSRRLFASVDVAAPVEVVWQALTDYDGLADFIPGLTENTCLEKRANGARLRQVGAQDVAMGVKFSARVVLDIHEFIAGAPTGLCSEEHNENKFPLPRGRTELGTPCDIAFSMVEGDFQAFQGIWRMQRLGEDGCCLSYALFVRPQVWLPVRLIQGRIKGEVATNLCAVRDYAETLYSSGGSSVGSEDDAVEHQPHHDASKQNDLLAEIGTRPVLEAQPRRKHKVHKKRKHDQSIGKHAAQPVSLLALRKPCTEHNNKRAAPVATYKYYADGAGAWDGDRIGLDALGGGGLAWEGAGTMSLGPDVDITDL